MAAAGPSRDTRDRPAPLTVDGLETEVQVDADLLDETLLPALRSVAARPRPHRRAFAFLVGPPGVGKSTLAAVLARRAATAPPEPLDVAVVGMDGFHHPNRYLETHHLHSPDGPVPLSAVKGAPETFDVASLAEHLEASVDQDLVWPAYDRRVHDVVPGTDPVTAGLVLLEGNWLLLDEPGWRDLAAHAAYVVLLTADAGLLRERLVGRKVRGGLSRSAAEEFYERSDRLNVERVLASSDLSKVDLTLRVRADGTITQGDLS